MTNHTAERNATNRIRTQAPNIPARTLARLINTGSLSGIIALLPVAKDNEARMAAALARDVDAASFAPRATIYNRIRRFDATQKQSQTADAA